MIRFRAFAFSAWLLALAVGAEPPPATAATPSHAVVFDAATARGVPPTVGVWSNGEASLDLGEGENTVEIDVADGPDAECAAAIGWIENGAHRVVATGGDWLLDGAPAPAHPLAETAKPGFFDIYPVRPPRAWGVQALDVRMQSPSAQLRTQAERGRGYGKALRQIVENLPFVAGVVDFGFQNLADSEGQGWGLVDNEGRPYQDYVKGVADAAQWLDKCFQQPVDTQP